MRIMHVVESFGGGVFVSVTQLCNMQIQAGHDVFLAHSLRPETPENYQDFLLPAVKMSRIELSRAIEPYRDLKGLLNILRMINSLKPDILHLHSSKAGIIGRIAALLSGLHAMKVFYSPRGFAFLQGNLKSFLRLFYFLIEKAGAHVGGTIVACSRGEAEEAEKLGHGPVVLVENAVDEAQIPLKKFRLDPEHITIGTLGRLCPQKNPLLFKMLAEAFIDSMNIHFIWIGGGEDENGLSRLKNIRMPGWLSRKDALLLMSEFDIYVQTSLWEGMPLAVIEAMMAGIPVVVTDSIGNRDIVEHGVTGFIAASEKELIMFVKILIADSKLRQDMGQKAREKAISRFGLQRLAAEIQRIYTSA